MRLAPQFGGRGRTVSAQAFVPQGVGILGILGISPGGGSFCAAPGALNPSAALGVSSSGGHWPCSFVSRTLRSDSRHWKATSLRKGEKSSMRRASRWTLAETLNFLRLRPRSPLASRNNLSNSTLGSGISSGAGGITSRAVPRGLPDALRMAASSERSQASVMRTGTTQQ